MIRRPPRSTRTDTLFPYTTLFRSLPIERASRAVTDLERRLVGRESDLDRALRVHAALYSDLWCDPRIGASVSARRVMLAMVSLLHEREETPRFVARSRERTA